MGGGREEETQCREVGASQLLFTVSPNHGTWGPGNTGLEEGGDGMKCYPKDVLKPSPSTSKWDLIWRQKRYRGD